MIRPDAEVISNTPPFGRKRIDLNPKLKSTVDSVEYDYDGIRAHNEVMADIAKAAEAERIWNITKQVAQSSEMFDD